MIVLAAMLLQASPSEADIADGRCVVVMASMGRQAQAADRPSLHQGMMYFFGKIVGRSGNDSVAPALKKGAEAMVAAGGDDALGTLAAPCEAELNGVALD